LIEPDAVAVRVDGRRAYSVRRFDWLRFLELGAVRPPSCEIGVAIVGSDDARSDVRRSTLHGLAGRTGPQDQEQFLPGQRDPQESLAAWCGIVDALLEAEDIGVEVERPVLV
jgi:hypothetical protein